jgi:carbon-monoxide dehydrogenase large subunit
VLVDCSRCYFDLLRCCHVYFSFFGASSFNISLTMTSVMPRSLSALLASADVLLRLVTPNVGGAFGMKAFVYPEQALVVWASRKLERPVKWQEDRSEAFVSDNQGRDHTTCAEFALDETGHFLGLRVSILANLGAYLSPFGCFVPTRSTDLVSGLYSIGAIHVNVKGVCTNTVPVCAYRGAGRPEAAYLLERIVDAAARELGMSPDAIRRVNFVPPSAMPYTSATKLVLDSGEFEKVMDTCMAAAEWSSFAKRRVQGERNDKLRGIGMATYTERCGGGFPEVRGHRQQIGKSAALTGLRPEYRQTHSVNSMHSSMFLRCPASPRTSPLIPRIGPCFFSGNREIFQKNREAIEHERAITERD